MTKKQNVKSEKNVQKAAQVVNVQLVAKDGSNWRQVFKPENVGATVQFADGTRCKILQYYKSHLLRKGNKTSVEVELNGKTQTIETDLLRATYCPDYKTSATKPKTHKTFADVFKELQEYAHTETEKIAYKAMQNVWEEIKKAEAIRAERRTLQGLGYTDAQIDQILALKG